MLVFSKTYWGFVFTCEDLLLKYKKSLFVFVSKNCLPVDRNVTCVGAISHGFSLKPLVEIFTSQW